MSSRAVYLPVPDEVLETVAERVAEIVVARLQDHLQPQQQRWMRTAEAAEYLGWTRGALYGWASRNAIPHYKVERMLLFNREELDAWLDTFRAEPRIAAETPLHPAPRERQVARTMRRQQAAPAPAPLDLEKRPRERTLPPPLGGDDTQKARWAHDLEISLEQLEDMTPRGFDIAWKERNERLRRGGVFENLESWKRSSEGRPSRA